jgi:hypothetical protein
LVKLSITGLFIYPSFNLFLNKGFKDLKILIAVLVIYVAANTKHYFLGKLKTKIANVPLTFAVFGDRS